MMRIGCPVCGGNVTTRELPDRLPLVVPQHDVDAENRCPGSGRLSSQAWMVKAAAGRSAKASEHTLDAFSS